MASGSDTEDPATSAATGAHAEVGPVAGRDGVDADAGVKLANRVGAENGARGRDAPRVAVEAVGLLDHARGNVGAVLRVVPEDPRRERESGSDVRCDVARWLVLTRPRALRVHGLWLAGRIFRVLTDLRAPRTKLHAGRPKMFRVRVGAEVQPVIRR